MSTKPSRLDPAFIEKQRQLLIKLRGELSSAVRDAEAEEAGVNEESTGTREYEDDAQKLATLELDGALRVRDLERRGRIDRALMKIEEGTYGFSDMSGQPIPRERLEVVPESIYTFAEEQALEKKR
ncbi:MAG: TraR/DksA family transcriptional regulator [Steroidobacteraceae bacterium]